MHRTILALLALLLASTAGSTYFGRNKVQTGAGEWWELGTEHFTIYFPRGGDQAAESLMVHAESVLVDLSRRFDYLPESSIPIVLYMSPGAFRQTNIITAELPRAVGGFTEYFKGRVVIPFGGYWAEFRHLVAHELNHAFIFDMLYRRSLEEVISARTPLWVLEGLAEYTSEGWNAVAEAEFRDLVIGNRIVSLQELGRRRDYLVYPQGQAVYHFMEQRYGEEVLRDFVRGLRAAKGLEATMESTIGMTLAQFDDRFQEWARETYWSSIDYREGPGDVGRPVYGDDDERVSQGGTVISDDGGLLAGLEYHRARLSVTVRSAIDGEVVWRPLTAGGPADIGLSPLFGVCDFSPSADTVVVAYQTTAGSRLALCTRQGRTDLPLEMDLIRSPAWSPDGVRIAFCGMEEGTLDLFVWDLREGTLSRLTDDPPAQLDPSWRENDVLCAVEGHGDATSLVAYGSEGADTLLTEPSGARYPMWVGSGVVFLSNRDGFTDLYMLEEATGDVRRLTALYRTIDNPSWAGSAGMLSFLSRDWGGSAVFLAYGITDRTVVRQVSGDLTVGEVEQPFPDDPPAPADGGAPDGQPPPDDPEGIPPPGRGAPSITEAPAAPGLLESDSLAYTVSPYSPALSLDYAQAMAQYDSYLGLAGYTQIVLSDILAHHRVVIDLDLDGGSVSDADAALLYWYLPRRTDLGIGAYRQSWRYLFRFSDGHLEEVRDTDLGGFAALSHPLSPALRLEGSLGYRRLSRTGLWNSDADIDEDIATVSGAVVYDDALWGSVGPRVGSRLSATAEYAPGIAGSASYVTLGTDLRRYFWVTGDVTFAARLAAGTSWGEDAQTHFLGGPIPHRQLWGEVTSISDVLGFYTNYGDMLRGYDYAGLSGRRYGVLNLDLRVPFFERIVLDAPLPVTVTNGRGALFVDLGTAFDDLASWRGASTEDGYRLEDLAMGLGLGYRINLGFILLMHDLAWSTDIRSISDKPTYYVTFGAEY